MTILAKKLTFFFLLFCIFLLSAHFVLATNFALEISYPEIFGHHIDNTSTFGEFICYFFALGMDLAFLISVLVIAFGGVYYLVSYGRGKFTSEAKEWIKSGITGLLIVSCSALIVYTINPNMGTCKLDFLPEINFNPFSSSTTPPSVPVVTYNEIPIGTLTENLLTRTMDCYGFDQSGNPVDGDQATENVLEPTYVNHDRADCLVQLMDGAQKKGQVIAELSSKITDLMNACSCVGKCDPAPPCQGICPPPPACGAGCGGPCVGGSCQQPAGTQDCCPTVATDTITGAALDPQISVKQQIEHGPISLAIGAVASSGLSEDCKAEPIEYSGLDEFRCPNPIKNAPYKSCENIASFVEKQTQSNGRTFNIIDQEKWEELNLQQQLIYFKEKSNEIKQKIQDDIDELDKARSTLSKCYLAIPYVDFLKTYKNTKQNEKIILKNPEAFSDPETNEPIDVSKYCSGFNYNNSSCLKKCNDACPDTSPEAIELYRTCSDPERENQEACIEDAYNSRPCIYGTDASQKFDDCISTCHEDCLTDCSSKHLACSDEYDFCQNQCNSNGQCVLDNAGSCLFGAENFANCASQTTDQGNTNYCITSAYSCKNGSDQYAGYQDCAEPSNTKCSYFTDKEECDTATECVWNGENCLQNYSASFFYDNKDSQKCPAPYSNPQKGTSCYSGVANTETSLASVTRCRDICPETQKCPTDSFCPDCPCDQITDPSDPTKPLPIKFSVPADSIGIYITRSKPISAHQMVGPQCNEYSYNDDPLTFYCQDNIFSDPSREGLSSTPLGASYRCSKEGEVPIGQMVDSAKSWAEALIENIDELNNKDIKPMLDQMTKIGEAIGTNENYGYSQTIVQDYCRCGARFEINQNSGHNGEPICQTNCQEYDLWWPILFEGIPIDWICIPYCDFKPCEGSPCQQITDYLAELWLNYKNFKLDFIDFYTTMLQEPRSDIMKELTYSRETTNKCSSSNSAFGAQVRLLNCTRAEHEEISPISTGKTTFNDITVPGCYGGQGNGHLGKIFDLTDNWFCCEEYGTTQPTSSNPIYNTQQ